MSIFDPFAKRNEQPPRLDDDVNVFRVGNNYLVDRTLWNWVNPSARSAFDAAQKALMDRDIQSAMEGYKAAIMAEPRWHAPYYEMGVALDRLNHPEQAARCYQKAIELAPDWPASYFNLGKYFRDIGDYGTALELFKRYLTLDPSDPDGYLYIGSIYDRLGDTAKENLAYENALRVDVNCFVAHLNLGINKVAEEQYGLAKRHLQRAVEIAPANSQEKNKALAELTRCESLQTRATSR